MLFRSAKNAAKNGNMFYYSGCATKNLTIKYRPRSRVLSISSRLVKQQGEKKEQQGGKKRNSRRYISKNWRYNNTSLLFLRSLGAPSLSAKSSDSVWRACPKAWICRNSVSSSALTHSWPPPGRGSCHRRCRLPLLS